MSGLRGTLTTGPEVLSLPQVPRGQGPQTVHHLCWWSSKTEYLHTRIPVLRGHTQLWRSVVIIMKKVFVDLMKMFVIYWKYFVYIIVKNSKIFKSFFKFYSSATLKNQQSTMKVINLISLFASIYLTLTRTLGLCEDLTFPVTGNSVIRGSTLCTGIIGVVSLIKFGQNLIIDLNLQDSFPSFWLNSTTKTTQLHSYLR